MRAESTDHGLGRVESVGGGGVVSLKPNNGKKRERCIGTRSEKAKKRKKKQKSEKQKAHCSVVGLEADAVRWLVDQGRTQSTKASRT